MEGIGKQVTGWCNASWSMPSPTGGLDSDTAPVDTGITGGNGNTGVINKYTVYWGASGVDTSSENKADVEVADGTTYTITGLTNGTEVFFIVTASNDTGESAASTEQPATPSATKVDVASVEINEGATANVAMGNTLQLNVTVLPNNASDKRITWSSSYDSIATVSNTGLVTPVRANNNPIRITATSTDDSTKSAFINVAVKEANREPGAPRITNLLADDMQVTVSWTAPTDTGIINDDGSTGVITKYTVYWGTSAGVTTSNATGSKATGDGNTLSLVIDSLANGTPYYFIVTAWNTSGESVPATEESATPLDNLVPGAPNGRIMVAPGDGEVTVSWIAPTNTGKVNGNTGVINKYTVYWGTSTGVTTSTADGSKSTSDGATVFLVIDGLNNGTPYYFIVTATNNTGESDATDESFATTPSATQPVTYAVGDIGPAGGIIFYAKASSTEGWQYLEAALNDETSSRWGGATALGRSTGTSIGSGEANTAEIVAALGANGGTAYAAKICDDLVIGTFTDWFLPSKDELAKLYDQRSTVGGFSTTLGRRDYWSSSEHTTPTLAWMQEFTPSLITSQPFGGHKVQLEPQRLRPVRAF